MNGPCMCGDLYCGTCGPLQGNTHCGNCGKWSADGGCDDPEACACAMQAQAEAMAAAFAEELEDLEDRPF